MVLWRDWGARLSRSGQVPLEPREGPRIKDLRNLFVTRFRTPVAITNFSVRLTRGVNTGENLRSVSNDRRLAKAKVKGDEPRSHPSSWLRQPRDMIEVRIAGEQHQVVLEHQRSDPQIVRRDGPAGLAQAGVDVRFSRRTS